MVKLTCKINMGMALQQVYIEGRNTPGKKPIETYWVQYKELAKFIIKQKDIDEVYLSGPKIYTSKIEETVKTQYDFNNIQFFYI